MAPDWDPSVTNVIVSWGQSSPVTSSPGGHRQLCEVCSQFCIKGVHGGSVDSTHCPTKADGERAYRGGEPCREHLPREQESWTLLPRKSLCSRGAWYYNPALPSHPPLSRLWGAMES